MTSQSHCAIIFGMPAGQEISDFSRLISLSGNQDHKKWADTGKTFFKGKRIKILNISANKNLYKYNKNAY